MNKQKQALFIIIFAIFSWVEVSAQLIMEDVVYLKNGSVIRGIIVNNENDSIRIARFRNYFNVFTAGDIKKIEKEEIKLSKRSLRSNIIPDYKDLVTEYKGFYSYSTIGMLIGKSESDDANTYSFHTIAGYGFNRIAGVGLGIGVEKLKTEIIPVFVSFKSVLMERTNSPFILFQAGYSFPLSDEKKSGDQYNPATYHYTGGLNVGFDLGIYSSKHPKRAFTITAGYRYQLIEETSSVYYWWENATETKTYQFNRIAVKIGFLFM